MFENEEGEGEGGNGGDGQDGSGAGAGAGAGGSKVPGPGWTEDTWKRFQTQTAGKQAAEARAAELERQLNALTEKAATADTLAAAVAAEKARADRAEGKFSTYTEIASAVGTTDVDTIELFDRQYSKLPAKDRPKRGDWIAQLRADLADEAKAAAVPGVVKPFLATRTEDKGTGTGANGTPRNPGGANGNDGAKPVDEKLIRAAAEKAQITGDWSEYKALRAKTRWGGDSKTA